MISNGQKTYQFINCDWHFLVWLKNSLCCFNCNLSCLPPEMRTYSQSMYNAIVKSSELINMKIEWNLSTNQALFWWTRLLGFSHRPIRRTQIDGLSNTIYRWWLSERERERERERENCTPSFNQVWLITHVWRCWSAIHKEHHCVQCTPK